MHDRHDVDVACSGFSPSTKQVNK